MKFIDSLRFSAFREIRARWPLLLALPIVFAVSALLPNPYDEAWSLFSLLVASPAILVLLAAGGPAAADPFWRGLRGSAVASVGMRASLHLLPVLVLAPLALGHTGIFSENLLETWPIVLLYLFQVTLYSTTLAARSLTSGFAVLAGPLMAVLVLAAGTWVNVAERFIPLQWSLAGRMAALSSLALVLACVWEGRDGVWGTSLRRRGLLALVPALLFLAVSVGLEVGLRVPMPGHLHVLGASDGGSRVALKSDWLLHQFNPEESLGRAWIWKDGHLRALEGVGVEAVVFGPEGSLLVVSRSELSLAMPYRADLTLLTADGARARCEDLLDFSNLRWSDDGRSVRILGGNAVSGLEAGVGCAPLPPEVQEVVFAGHTYTVSSVEPTVLRVDGQPLGPLTRLSNSHGAVREERGFIHLVGDETGVLAVVRTTGTPEHLYRGQRLYQMAGDQAVVLDDSDGYRIEEGRVCRPTEADTMRCWDPAGTLTEVPRAHAAHATRECVEGRGGRSACRPVELTSTGQPLPLPADPWSFYTRLDPDHLRYFYDDHFIDAGPEGLSTTRL